MPADTVGELARYVFKVCHAHPELCRETADYTGHSGKLAGGAHQEVIVPVRKEGPHLSCHMRGRARVALIAFRCLTVPGPTHHQDKEGYHMYPYCMVLYAGQQTLQNILSNPTGLRPAMPQQQLQHILRSVAEVSKQKYPPAAV